MAIPAPDCQADVNTRGRTDNAFYDHINAAVMSATGSPTLAGTGNSQYLTFNGSSQYVQTGRPASLAAAFADSQFTIAARFKTTGAVTAFSHIFGFNNAADTRRVNLLLDSAAGDALAAFDVPSGTDVFLSSATQGDDTNWHVITMRRDGTDLSLWLDGTEIDTDVTAPGTMGTLDELCIARRGGTSDNWHLPGSVQWIAVWESALTDGQIQELDDNPNPFAITISVDDTTIDLPQTITITKSEAWAGTVTATLGGGAITLSGAGGATRAFSLTVADFYPSSALNAVRWRTDVTLAVTDSDGTYKTTAQIYPTLGVGEDHVESPGGDIGTFLAVPGAVAGDPHFAFWHLGDNVRDTSINGITDAGSGYFSPITLPSQGRLMAYDVSAAQWLAPVNTDYFTGVSEEISISRATQPIGALTPWRNEMKWSSGFGNAAHTRTRSSAVWLPSELRHDGYAGCWELAEDSTASNTHLIALADITLVTGTVYTYQIKAKASGRSFVAIQIGTGSEAYGATVPFAYYNLTTGATSSVTGGTATTTSLGSDWWLLTLVSNATTATASTAMRIKLANSTPSDSYSGDGASGVLLADAQLETGSTANAYVHTETVPLRSDQVIVRGRRAHNLVGYSNDLSNAAWTKTRCSISGSITLTAGASNGWGSSVLYKVVEDTSTDTHLVNNAADAMSGNASGVVACRFLAQGDGTRNHITVRVYGDSASNYYAYTINLADGTNSSSSVTGTAALYSLTTTLVDTVSSRPVYEVIVRGWPSTTSDTLIYQLMFLLHNGSSNTYLGTSNGVYVGKIQVINEYALPAYLETTTAVPVFAANASGVTLNGVAAAVAGNNLLTYSEDFSNAAWTKTDITLASANVIGPNTVYADRVTEGTAGTAILVRATAATVSAGATVSARLWVKRSGVVQWVRVRLTNSGATNGGDVWFDIQNGVEGTNTNVGSGTSTSGTITAAASAGWYLLTITTTLAGGDTTALLSIRSASADASATPVNSSVYWVSEAALQVGAAAEYAKTVATAEHVIDRSSAIITLPGIDTFNAAAAHAATGWYDNIDATLTDGTTTLTGPTQFVPYVPGNFGVLGPIFSSYAPAGSVTGDDVYIHVISGAGTADPVVMAFTPSGTATVRFLAYSGTAWRSYREYTLTRMALRGVVRSIARDIITPVVEVLN